MNPFGNGLDIFGDPLLPMKRSNRDWEGIPLEDLPGAQRRGIERERKLGQVEGREILILGNGGGIMIRSQPNTNLGGSQSRY